MGRFLRFVVAAAMVMAISWAVHAQTVVTLIAPGGIRAPIEKLIPGFESKTGYKVKATFGSGLGTKRQVTRGEAFDVPVVQPPYPEVIASGNVVENTATPLANVAVGVAVKQGMPKPDISTPEAVRKMLLAAKSVSIPDSANGAAAGVSFDKTLEQLGIANQMRLTLKRAHGGAAAMAMVAKGEVEIGLTFMSEMNTPGIEKVGPLPREISPRTGLVGFVSTHAKNPEAARALLRYLSSPEAAAVYKSLGMEPGE